jgi:hypothetical protein
MVRSERFFHPHGSQDHCLWRGTTQSCNWVCVASAFATVTIAVGKNRAFGTARDQMRPQSLGPGDTAVSSGTRRLDAVEQYQPSKADAHLPQAHYAITDGHDAVGTVEVCDRYFVADDLDCNIVGRFHDLKDAVRSLPDGRAR